MSYNKLLALTPIILLTITSCKQEVVKKKIGSCYIQEGTEVMYLQKTNTGNIDTINLEYVNASFFEIISDKMPKGECVNNDIWAKDKMSVWYKQNKIEGANPQSFELIANAYSKDKNNIYYKQKILSINNNNFEVLGNFYAKNKSNIWYKGKKVAEEVNIANFLLIDSYFSSDKESIYLNNDTSLLKIPDSDAKTFMKITKNSNSHLNSLKYYKDKDKIYCIDTEKNIGEPNFLSVFTAFTESFEVLNEKYYTKDNFNIYYKNKIIENADFKTFKPLGNNYAKDSTRIFFRNKTMYGTNYKTFKIHNTDSTDAKDSLAYFLQGKRLTHKL